MEEIAGEAQRQVESHPITAVPDAARRFFSDGRLTDSEITAIYGEVSSTIVGNAEAMAQLNVLMRGMLNPFSDCAQGVGVPQQPVGSQLIHNMVTESYTIPEGCDRMVIVMNPVVGARNGEVSATMYFVNSRLTSRTEPQQLNDGSVLGIRKLATGLRIDDFKNASLYSAGIKACDLTADDFKRGAIYAAVLDDRSTHPAQLYPGKIGRVTEDYLVDVPKDQAVSVVIRNSELFTEPNRRGLDSSQLRYANLLQGRSTFASAPTRGEITAGEEAVLAYNGKDLQFGQLAANAQMAQSNKGQENVQTCYIGTVPAIPVRPHYPPQPSERIQVLSSEDIPALQQSCGIDNIPMLSRDLSAVRFAGTLKLCGPVNTLPHAGGPSSLMEQPQGVAIKPFASDAPEFNTTGAGFGQPFIDSIDSIDSLGSDVSAYANDGQPTTGANNHWLSGIGTPPGNWRVVLEILGMRKAAVAAAGTAPDPEVRPIGRAEMLCMLGTKATVSYSAQAVATPLWDDVEFSASMNSFPIVNTESLGSVCIDGITVVPGQGLDPATEDPVSPGEVITGWRIWMQSWSGDLDGGQARDLPCIASQNTCIGTVTVSHVGAGYMSIPNVTFAESPLGPQATAKGHAIMTADPTDGATTVARILVTDPGFGYTEAPTITIGAPAAGPGISTAIATCALKAVQGGERFNSNQFGVEFTPGCFELIKNGADAISSGKKGVIILDGLTPLGAAGSSSASNVSVTLSSYVSFIPKSAAMPQRVRPTNQQLLTSTSAASALALVADYAPSLHANEIARQLNEAVFLSHQGDEAALKAASDGLGAGVFGIFGKMKKFAKKAYKTVKGAVDSVDHGTKAALARLAKPVAMRALKNVKDRVGLGHVADGTIIRHAELAGKKLAELFGAHGGMHAGSMYAGTDAPLHASHGDFWRTLTKVGGAALPLLLRDDSISTNVKLQKQLFASSQAKFPVLSKTGDLAGTLELTVAPNPKPLLTYTTIPHNGRTLHYDSRLKSVDDGHTTTHEVLGHWFEDHPEASDVYVSVRKLKAGQHVYGRSWEASLASAVAGKPQLITGTIEHVSGRSKAPTAHIGGIVGAGAKAQLSNLAVPVENAAEVPGNTKLVSAVRL
uniref:Uncharacterized protein n=1 Tax=viral metagenome TaxID=1070528 RepID=A0A2V0RB90_9ZZZZ